VFLGQNIAIYSSKGPGKPGKRKEKECSPCWVCSFFMLRAAVAQDFHRIKSHAFP
jgi:hypothetical protein